jgi:hypothetical protein
MLKRVPYKTTLIAIAIIVIGFVKAVAQKSIPIKVDITDYGSQYLNSIVDTDTLIRDLTDMINLNSLTNEFKEVKKQVASLGLFSKFEKAVEKVKNFKNVYRSTDVQINYYRTNEVDSFTFQNDFLNANVSLNLKIGTLPFSMQMSTIMEQGKIRTDFSYANLRLDIASYQEDLKQRISVQSLRDKFDFNQLTDKIRLNPKDASVLKNDAQFNLYNVLITHPKVLSIKQKIEDKLDSITKSIDTVLSNKLLIIKDTFVQKQLFSEWNKTQWRDSITGELQTNIIEKLDILKSSYLNINADSISEKKGLIEGLMKAKKVYNKFEKQYENLWEERKKIIDKIEQLKTKLIDTESNLKQLSDVKNFKEKALNSKYLSLKDRIVLNVKGFEVGQIGVDENDFTMRFKVIDGIKFDYENKNRSWGILYGNTRIQNFETPVYISAFQRSTLGRTFLYAKFAYTTRDSGIININVLNAQKTQDTLLNGLLTSNYNTVFNVGYEKKLTKGLGVQTEVALSNIRKEMSFSTNEGFEKFDDNIAASATMYWSKNSKFNIGLGYYYIGNRFVTFGNDFLISNRNGLKVNFKSSFFKEKLNFKIEFKQGFLNTPSVLGLSQSSIIQTTAEMNWLVSRQGSLSFQYIPNTLTERPLNRDGRGYDYRTNIYILTGNFSYEIGHKKQISLFSISNLNQQIDFFDSLRVNQTEYINIRHESFFTKTSSISLNSNAGLSENFDIKTGFNQLDIRLKIAKNIKLVAGIQLVKRIGDLDWRKGIVTNINCQFKKGLIMRLGVIYRRKSGESYNSRNEWIGNSSISMQF